jgi:hypothetical protein
VALFRFSPDVRQHIHEMPELSQALASQQFVFEDEATQA